MLLRAAAEAPNISNGSYVLATVITGTFGLLAALVTGLYLHFERRLGKPNGESAEILGLPKGQTPTIAQMGEQTLIELGRASERANEAARTAAEASAVGKTVQGMVEAIGSKLEDHTRKLNHLDDCLDRLKKQRRPKPRKRTR